jgi:hypothetical protein
MRLDENARCAKAVVCSMHFDDDDLMMYPHDGNVVRRELRANALPIGKWFLNIFLNLVRNKMMLRYNHVGNYGRR